MKTNKVIFSLLILCLLASSCVKENFSGSDSPAPDVRDYYTITGLCLTDTRSLDHSSTKVGVGGGLIDQMSSHQLDANFLRVDEEIGEVNHGKYTFYASIPFENKSDDNPISYADEVNWEKGYLSEASIFSADGTENIHYRTIMFSPKQTYSIYAPKADGEEEVQDTIAFYHTRMVGWYPRNCKLVEKDGTQRFEMSKEQNATHEIDGRSFKSVRFTGLDGSKDVMVSNVCEGQYWHSTDPRKSVHTSDSWNRPYRVPMGHYQTYSANGETFTATYSNYFKFRHYMSAVRFWGFVPDQDSNSHALDMWGNITDVVLRNQPTSVCVTLPEEPAYDSNAQSLDWRTELNNFDDPAKWGQAYGWGDFDNFSVQTGPMFGNDPNHSGENYTVDFSKIDMRGIGDKDHAVYMGDSLIRPDYKVEVEIHTKYGVYVAILDKEFTYTYTDENGDSQSETVDLFQAGYYYDIYLSLQTDGTISAIIETRGKEKYFDLTHSVPVAVDGVPDENNDAVTYRYSNCYIVDPSDPAYDMDSDGICDYDGFFFSGLVAGNGDEGILDRKEFYPSSADIKNPVTARLVWESSRLLVSNIELINGYIKFKVPGIKDGSFTPGNAVIGIYDRNDVCLWSWHIWIADKPKEISYTTSTGNTITVLDRNLGATFGGVPSNATDLLASYGLYYQWGRKDPSIGPKKHDYSLYDSSTADYYDYASDVHNVTLPSNIGYPSLKDGVEHPMNLILPIHKSDKGYDFDWLYILPDNLLWGHNHVTNTDSKTIYDPCPFGYKVPAGEISKIMEESTNYNKIDGYGIVFTSGTSDELFFPFAGFKGVDKGLTALTTMWNYVGAKGDYQEAVYSKSTSTNINQRTIYHRQRNYISNVESWQENRVMSKDTYTYSATGDTKPVNGKYIFSDWTNRRTAASVRCVKFDESKQ